jgi:hypothetical protein
MAEQEDATIKAVLDDVRRDLPSEPEVADLQYELYVDSLGEDAARITVVLRGDDDASERPFDWRELKPIRDAIFRAFQAKNIGRWPYVNFRLASEAVNPPQDDGVEGASLAG